MVAEVTIIERLQIAYVTVYTAVNFQSKHFLACISAAQLNEN